MPKNYCIMQIWAESGKSALPICNYSQILYQFLTFTQNLKRSRFFLCINMILIGLYGIFVDCPHVVSSYAVLIFCPRIRGYLGDSYSILGDFDEDNRNGGIGRNWQEGLIRIQNTSL